MQLTVRQPSASEDAKHYTTERLRGEYLIETVFAPDDAILTYSHFDRIIAGGVMPVSKSVELVGCKELASDTFLQRREMGVINIGGKGKIAVDGVEYDLKQYDGLYVGMGAKTLSFTSDDPADPAKFYLSDRQDRHRQGQQAPAGQRGDLQQARHQPVHPSGGHAELPAVHGHDPACAGQQLEFHALPHARAPHGGLFLLRSQG